jgi:K(+)-stimulated pyrophosphate-energized sodium pump
MGNQFWFIIATLVAGAISIGIAVYLFFWVMRQNAGSAKAQQVAGWIRDGARSYLKKLYSALGLVALIVGLTIAVIFSSNLDKLGTPDYRFDIGKGLLMMGVFALGSLCSALAGYMGMTIAVAANVRTATAAHKHINQAFRVSFYAGSVMGLAMVGLAVIGMGTIYLLTGDPNVVLGFSFGASTLALLAKAGGGIYTKSADIAADLVGKVEVGIPEDDPRNPAVVADNVGDNVGHGRGYFRQLRRQRRGCHAAGVLVVQRAAEALIHGLPPGVVRTGDPGLGDRHPVRTRG